MSSHLSAIESDHVWLDGRVPNGYWHERRNRVAYMNWLGMNLRFVRCEDWYQVRNRDFRRNSGATMLDRFYGSSVLEALRDLVPDYDWLPWLFSKTPRGYWDDAENRQAYMQWLERKLQISCEEDWYEQSERSFDENRGRGLLTNYYHGSILSALQEYRPDVGWKPWCFRKVPNGYWRLPGNRRRYFEWLADRLHFRSLNDWDSLTRQTVRETGGAGLLSHVFGGSLLRLRNDVADVTVWNQM
ncbi:MAG: hypothetical protein GY903_01555 [Fuerstiella sp.]|nr:hypothetical protein [Fuerstiella sp.]MCP4853163.1 hypothetical protein [Fuerstiella sp.]